MAVIGGGILLVIFLILFGNCGMGGEAAGGARVADASVVAVPQRADKKRGQFVTG